MILLAYGTRPEFVKTKPLIYEFDANNFKYITLFTGQHKDLVNEFQPDYEAQIIDGENRLDSILTSIPDSLHNVLKLYPKITHILVQGDTTSALAIALSAFHHDILITQNFFIFKIHLTFLCWTQMNVSNLRN